MKISVLAILLVALCTQCDGNVKKKNALPPPTVTVAIAQEDVVYPFMDFNAHASAGSDATIEPRIIGHLISDSTRAGEFVQKGEILYTIDKDQFKTKVEQAEGEVLIATANLKNATLELKRQGELFAKGATSREAYENALYKEIEMQGALKIQKAKFKSAELDLSYTDIRAPFSGRVSFNKSNVGNLVSPGTQLATIVDLDPIKIKFNLSETDLLSPQFGYQTANQKLDSDLSKTLKVLTFFQNGAEYPLEGRLSSFDNRIDQMAGTLLIETLFPNPDDKILPGMFMKVRLQSRHGMRDLLIPSRAIQQTQAGAQIFIVNNDDIVEVHYIKTGLVENGRTQVISGLKAGDRVIVEGVSKIRPGDKVLILNSSENK